MLLPVKSEHSVFLLLIEYLLANNKIGGTNPAKWMLKVNKLKSIQDNMIQSKEIHVEKHYWKL